ncbi:hypothetical protein FA13DRAFT_1802534 [Coprinellus micaceus]|uniref:Uncharacterized protein n=1 Tax=Coprinellus micaceus TaxID=71717 RepID=A0A4Y7SC78_COPMI|nr:hypothetical protein FA13DRAFT_1802534 [Coprinellus micaceus]
MPPKRAAADNRHLLAVQEAEDSQNNPNNWTKSSWKSAGSIGGGGQVEACRAVPTAKVAVTFEDLEACATELVQASGKSENTLKTYRRLLKEARAFLRTFRKKESKKEKMRCAKKPNEKKPEHEAHSTGRRSLRLTREPNDHGPRLSECSGRPAQALYPPRHNLHLPQLAWYYDEMDGIDTGTGGPGTLQVNVVKLLIYVSDDLDLSPPDRLCSDGTPFEYMVVNVCKRKNWTVKDETELTGMSTSIQEADQPAIDAYSLIKDWISVYTEILGRPCTKAMFSFQRSMRLPELTPTEALNEDKVRKLVRKHAGDARLAHADGYKSHCFRRGGAQYRFMYAALKESGPCHGYDGGGWANSEQGDTLVKYLLDELFTYEEEYRNALQPNDDGSTTTSRFGERRIASFRPDRISLAQSSVEPTSYYDRIPASDGVYRASEQPHTTSTPHYAQHQHRHYSTSTYELQPMPPLQLRGTVRAPAPYPQLYHISILALEQHLSPHTLPGAAQRPTTTHMPMLAPHTHFIQTPTNVNMACPSHTPHHGRLPSAPTPPPYTTTQCLLIASASTGFDSPADRPTSRHSHERTYDRNILANAWRQVIDDWEGKDPRRCPVPLRDWDATWHKKTPQAVVYHQRRVIAEEFINE